MSTDITVSPLRQRMIEDARCGAAPCRGVHARDLHLLVALRLAVTQAWPYKPFSFRELRKTFGLKWVRCDICRRYAPLSIRGLQDVDYRSKTFSCSRCGSEAYLTGTEPIKEAGMRDYRLDAIERPEHHPTAVARLTGGRPSLNIDRSGGELPEGKIDPRR